MKKIIPLLLCLSLLLTVGTVLAVPAAALGSNVNDSSWSDLELQALVYQEGTDYLSKMTDDYKNEDWGYKVIAELTDEDDDDPYEYELANLNMRGSAITPDRKYALLGHLNGGEFRGCGLYDFATGKITDVFYRYDEEPGATNGGFSYAKGIAADDRGNAYVGFAISSNWNIVSLGIAHINDTTKSFEKLYMDYVCDLSGEGDATGGTKVGVNGVEVVKRGEKYYCYVMLNYDYDALYCYDVTDPAKPVLESSFGDKGILVFNEDCAVKTDSFTLSDGDYLAVDEDGVIWLAAASKEGARGVMQISADGQSCLGVVESAQAYSVCRAGDYLLIGDKNAAAVHVYNVSDTTTEIATINPDEESATVNGVRYSRVQVIDDILFVASDDENSSASYNVFMAAPLTSDARALLNDMVKALEGKNVEGLTDIMTIGNMSADSYFENGEMLQNGSAQDWLASNRADGISGVESVAFRGWAFVTGQKAAAYGYVLDDASLESAVWDSYEFEERADVAAAFTGCDAATAGYQITINLADIEEGEHTLHLLVKTEEGTIAELSAWGTLKITGASAVASESESDSATEPSTGDQATEPATGDESGSESATEAATSASTSASTSDATAVAEDDGCSSVIGAGAAALVLSAMAAAVALKKKH